jgi:multidrug resistance efflux pump
LDISREKACQRLHHRVATPLNLYHDGRSYTAVDWSLGGFRVSDWDQWTNDLKLGDSLSWKFELPFQGFMIAFDVLATVVRIDPQRGHFACQFIDLDDRQTELMKHFIEQLIRGAMTPLKDTILRIDSPVTPVSTEPNSSPLEQLPVSRYPMRMVMMSLLYMTLGLGLFSLLMITVYENFLSLKVSTAATSTPLESIVSLVDGPITRVSSIIDTELAEGTPLLTIESPQLTKQIAEAKTAIEQKKLELEAQRKRYMLAIEITGSVTSREARLLQIDIDLVEQEVRLAMQNLLALYAYQEDLSILSPGDGRLVQLLHERGSVIKRGETLGFFQRDETPAVNVFVTEQEARVIYLDQLTQVHLLSLDQHWLGYVSEIKKDTLRFNSQQFEYRPENASQRNVRVKIKFKMDRSNRLKLRSGLPVEVRFATSKISQAVLRYLSKPESNPDGEPISSQQAL